MAYTVFSLASVPDTATARRLFDLHDLDDKAVSRVLFHRRKQQTGSTEILRWDQRALAGLTLIRCSSNQVEMQSFSLGRYSELEMLEAYYAAVSSSRCLLSWDGTTMALPLIHFRTLQVGLHRPAYWRLLNDDGGGFHVDLRHQLCPDSDDVPTLDEVVRGMGLPGAPGIGEKEIYDAWLVDDDSPVNACTDWVALQLFMLSMRWQRMTGALEGLDISRAEASLREMLSDRDQPHLREFLENWSEN